MARRLSSRRLLWLTYMLSRPSSTVQSCSPSRLYRTATAFGLNTLLLFCRCCAASHPHSSPFSTAPSPSPSLLSSRSTSHKSTLSFSAPGLLPTSVFSTNSSMSTIALSVNRILRFLRSGVSLTVMSLAFSFSTMVSVPCATFDIRARGARRSVCCCCTTSSVRLRLFRSSLDERP
jgi:hypothetical protein